MSILSPDRLARGMYWNRAWSLVSGCSHTSPGCARCWAAAEAHTHGGQANPKMQARYGGLTTSGGRWTGEVREMAESLDLPLRTRKSTVWSVWTDLFHEAVSDVFRLRAFEVIRTCAAEERGHVFLILTKRADRMAEFCRRLRFDPGELRKRAGGLWLVDGPEIGEVNRRKAGGDRLIPGYGFTMVLPNLWLGVTAENQEEADRRIPELLATPAAHRFVSVEPMLGPVDLREWLFEPTGRFRTHDGVRQYETTPQPRLDWVVAGGESGRGARPVHTDWARGLRDQCAAASVPFMWKQWSRTDMAGHHIQGRLFDGREHLEVPW